MRRKSDLGIFISFFLFYLCVHALLAFFHQHFFVMCVLNLIWKLISIQTIYQYLIADLKLGNGEKKYTYKNGERVFDSCWILFYWRHVLNKRITFVYGSINCLIFEYVVKSKFKQLEFLKIFNQFCLLFNNQFPIGFDDLHKHIC